MAAHANLFSVLAEEDRDGRNVNKDDTASMDFSEPSTTADRSEKSERVASKSSKSASAPRNELDRYVPKSILRSVQRSKETLQDSATPWPFTALCPACEDMFHHELPEEWDERWYDHHANLEALQAAVATGCGVCARTLQRFRFFESSDHSHSIFRILESPVRFIYHVEKFSHEVTLKIGMPYKERPDNFTEGYPLVRWTLFKPEMQYATPARIPRSTDNSVTWKLCKAWLYACRTQHEKCGDLRSDYNFQPSRLVEVSKKKEGQIQAKLNCKPNSTHSHYLTFSHCWGTKPFFVLRSDNLSMLQQSIPVEKLPKSMYDALVTTIRLGFRYIWIDSLCIVQDSEADWLKESSLMGQIYKHSTCNIAATGFKDGRQGMFVERDPEHVQCLRVGTNWGQSQTSNGEFYMVESKLWEFGVSKAPLNRRGWVLQERLLSPCVLHFGAQQLFWECFQSRTCEILPRGLPGGVESHATQIKSISFYDGRHDTTRSEDIIQLQDVYDSWYQIAHVYSLGNLTYPTDKLIALSGVAKEVGSILNDGYLAGLWRSDLPLSLLWIVSEKDLYIGIPFPPRAPSWSWASIDAGISFLLEYRLPREHGIVHSCIVETFVDAYTGDETGMVKYGYLRVRGPLTKAAFPGLQRPDYLINGRKTQAWADLDFSSEPCEDQSMVNLRRAENGVYFSTDGLSHTQFLSRQELYFLPIYSTLPPGHSLKTHGLILSPTPTSGEYIRVGILTVYGAAEETVLRPAEKLPPGAYEACDESNALLQYTIKIV